MKKLAVALGATIFIAMPAAAQPAGAQAGTPAPAAQGDKPAPSPADQAGGGAPMASADKPAAPEGAPAAGGEGGDKPAEGAASPN